MENEENITKEKDENEEKKDKKPPVKSSKKDEEPVSRIKFIGFHRHAAGAPWTMFPQMLASEESVQHKIKFLKGDCETYIIDVDLPQ
jgi:hypothetical protein